MKARLAAIKSPHKRPFKAQFPNVYKGDNYMACYKFCQQCKNHFVTARAKRSNHILFPIFFL